MLKSFGIIQQLMDKSKPEPENADEILLSHL